MSKFLVNGNSLFIANTPYTNDTLSNQTATKYVETLNANYCLNLFKTSHNLTYNCGFKYQGTDLSTLLSANFNLYTTSTNNVTLPANVVRMQIISVGGGGGGGTGGNQQNGDGGGAGGGGCGGITIELPQNPITNYNIIIGDGGARETSGNPTYLLNNSNSIAYGYASGGVKGSDGYAGGPGAKGTNGYNGTGITSVTMTEPTNGGYGDNGVQDPGGTGGFINYSTLFNNSGLITAINTYGKGGGGGHGDAKWNDQYAGYGDPGNNGFMIILYYYI